MLASVQDSRFQRTPVHVEAQVWVRFPLGRRLRKKNERVTSVVGQEIPPQRLTELPFRPQEPLDRDRVARTFRPLYLPPAPTRGQSRSICWFADTISLKCRHFFRAASLVPRRRTRSPSRSMVCRPAVNPRRDRGQRTPVTRIVSILFPVRFGIGTCRSWPGSPSIRFMWISRADNGRPRFPKGLQKLSRLSPNTCNPKPV